MQQNHKGNHNTKYVKGRDGQVFGSSSFGVDISVADTIGDLGTTFIHGPQPSGITARA